MAVAGAVAAGLVAAVAEEPGGIASQEEGSGFEVENVSWLGSVEDGRSVVVSNGFGDVRARFGGHDGQVEIFATLQHFAAEGPRLTVAAKESPAGVEVSVGYRVEQDGAWVTAPQPGQKKRADVVVFVPQGAPLAASTGHGLIEVDGTKSDVRATTVSGEIQVRKVDGDLDLTTDSGAILAALGAREAGRRQSLISGSGDLTVVLSEDANLTVRVATGGLISTDFSLRIERRENSRAIKQGEAVIGKGTTELVMSSESGHLRLVRQPVARKARARPREGS